MVEQPSPLEPEVAMPAINQLVGLLGERAPEVLQRLQAKYPQHTQELLRPGVSLGIKKQDNEMLVRVEVALASLKEIFTICDNLIPQVKSRMQRAGKFLLAGQILTTIGGASVFGAIAVNYPDPAKYTAATLALLGSIFTLVSQNLAGTLYGLSGSITDQFKNLVDCQIKSETIKREFEISQKLDSGITNASRLIEETVALLEKARRLESEIL